MSVNAAELVDVEKGRLDPRLWCDEEIYRQELKEVFARSWLFLAHDSMIPNRGDYITTFMGEDSVIVVRQRDGSVRAFLNQCRHRGMRLCRADLGTAKNFTCTYHGWTYDTAGNLIGVPQEEEAYHNEIVKEDWPARKVVQVDSYRGFIFGNWDATAPPLLEYLGDHRYYFDAFVNRTESGTEVLGGVHKWIIPANWKLGAEQFSSDMYHGPISHASAVMALTPEDQNIEQEVIPVESTIDGKAGRQESSPWGHGAGFFVSNADPLAVIMGEDLKRARTTEETVERLGEVRSRKMQGQHGTIFPNFSYLEGINTLRVWHPKGVDKMEVWAWVLVPKDASPEVRNAQRVATSRTFSAAGMFEQDDGENWVEIQRVLGGYIAQTTDLNAEMGLGHDTYEDPEWPGRISNVYCEMAARGFYGRWAEMMSGASWSELAAEAALAGSPAGSLR